MHRDKTFGEGSYVYLRSAAVSAMSVKVASVFELSGADGVEPTVFGSTPKQLSRVILGGG